MMQGSRLIWRLPFCVSSIAVAPGLRAPEPRQGASPLHPFAVSRYGRDPKQLRWNRYLMVLF